MQLAKLKESVRGVLFGALVAVCSSAFAAAEVWVSDTGSDGAAGTKESPYGTIVFALTKCDAGGTVHVMAGTYEITAEILVEQDVKVVGDGYETTTVKRKSGTCRVLHLKHADAVVSGLTLTAGSGVQGAGAYVEAGTLSGCHVTQNDCAANHGGGVYMTGSSSVVTNCLIDYNSSSGWGGRSSGVYVGTGSLLVDSDVKWNKKTTNNCQNGVGAQLSGGTMLRCRVMDNLLNGATYGNVFCGVGVQVSETGGLIDGCLFARNVAIDKMHGGGIGVSLSNNSQLLTIRNSTIVDNFVPNTGGGIYVEKGNVVVSNCVIQDNESFLETAAANVKIAGGTMTFSQCVSPAALPNGTDNIVATLDFVDTEDYVPRYHPAAVNAGWRNPPVDSFDLMFAMDAAVVWPEQEFSAKAYATAGSAGGVLTYRWDFGDGSGWSDWSASDETTHSYGTVGEYTVTLQAAIDGTAQEKTYQMKKRVSPPVAHVVEAASHPGHVPVYPYVDEETAATNIQDAVDAVADGATVIVHPGTYSVLDPVTVEKGITLESSDGRDVTILRSGLPTSVPSGSWTSTLIRRALYINHPDAVARGFTVRDCSIVNGASFPPHGFGSGVAIGSLGGTLDDTTLTANKAGVKICGALALFGSAAVVTNCAITGNVYDLYNAGGPGVYMTGGLLTHSTIVGNKQTRGGSQSDVCASGLRIEGGRAEYLTIMDNVSSMRAGGVHMNGTSAVVANCLIAGNSTTEHGGGAYVVKGTLLNCTLVGNTTTGGKGGGIYAEANAKIYGCIVQGSTTSSSDDGAGKPEWYGGTSANYAYCSSPVDFPSGSTDCGKGTVTFEPGTYKPIVGQPCIDLMPTSVYETLGLVIDDSTLDLYAQPRVSNVKIDAGCAEYQKVAYEATVELEARVKVGQTATFTVKDGGATGVEYSWRVDGGEWGEYSATANTLSITFTTAGNHGVEVRVKETVGEAVHGPYGCAFVIAPPTAYVVEPEQAAADGHVAVFPYESWATAATNVADAVAVACDESEVVVSDGVYQVSAPIELKLGTTVRSVNGAERTELRNIVPAADPVKTVHRLFFVDHRKARVEGFALTNGRMGQEPKTESDYGSGLLIGAEGGTVANCVISGCQSAVTARGIGFAILGANGVLSNCLVTANESSESVGCWAVGGFVKNGLVTQCVISNNVNNGRLDPSGASFGTYAAGLYLTGGRVSHCLFANNRFTREAAEDHDTLGGGAVYVEGNTAMIDNCLFVSNSASKVRGGAVYAKGGTLLNCTICENSAGTGGGVWASDSSVIRNCIIQDNVAATAADFYGTPNVTYSLCPTGLPEGEGNVEKPAVFKPGWKHRQSRMSPGVDAGSEEGYEEYLGGTDLFGRARVIGPRIDIGADEVSQDGLMLMVR